MAGGVEDGRGQFAVQQGVQLRCHVRGVGDNLEEVVATLAEINAPRTDLQQDHTRTGQEGEGQHGQSDGAGADEQDRLAPFGRGTVHGVGADAQGFHQGQLFEGHDIGTQQLLGREHQDVPHAAVHVYAQDVEVRAAVRFAHAAGHAVPAVHVGDDGAQVAGVEVRHVPAGRDDLHPQFVPEDAGVVEEGLRTLEGVQVRAADPDPANAY